MAKVSFSANVEDIRGKIGTNVYTAGRSGAVIRIRTQVKNPRTAAQAGVRSNLSKASAAFKNMTTIQVQAWAAYASGIVKHNPVNGKTYNPTANTIFTALTSKFLQVTPAGVLPMTPPASAFAGDTVTVTATAVSGTLTFAATGVNAAHVTTELLLQPLVSHNRTPQAKGYRSRGFVVFSSSVNDQDFNLNPGSYAPAYRFVNTLTGQDSELIILPTVTVG